MKLHEIDAVTEAVVRAQVLGGALAGHHSQSASSTTEPIAHPTEILAAAIEQTRGPVSRADQRFGPGATWTHEKICPGAAPAAGKQAPAFYRTKIGKFEITQISDGGRTFPMPIPSSRML